MVSDSPAGSRRRLRLVLRTLRDRHGLTQQQVADELDWSLSKVNRIENGEVTISVSDLHAALNLYKMEQDQQRMDLVALARAARKRDTSFDGYAPDALTPAMVKLVQFEREAVAIRTFFPAIVDGLLQTPEYAAAILDYVHGRDAHPGRHDAGSTTACTGSAKSWSGAILRGSIACSMSRCSTVSSAAPER